MNPKAVVIVIVTLLVAMSFVGVALSRDEGTSLLGPNPSEANRKASGTEKKLRGVAEVDGQTWGLRSYESERRELCLSQDVPGEGVATGCLAPEKLFADGPLFALRGGRQESASYKKLEWDNVWVYGIAHADIKSLTLVNMDCSTLNLSLDGNGAFLHVIGGEKIKKGELPYKLIARGSGGQVLADKTVALGIPKNAKDAGLTAPRPKAACS